MTPEQLIPGLSYTFEDGNKIEIIQVRMIDEQRGGPSVT